MTEDEQTEQESAWCIVANIVYERTSNSETNTKHRGTKHFPPGAKIYILSFFWGTGMERAAVVGRHRGSHRYVKMVISSDVLANWRVELVYSPYLVTLLQKYGDYNLFLPGKEAAKQRAEEIVAHLPPSLNKTQSFITRFPDDGAQWFERK